VSAAGGPAPPSPKWDQAVAPARQMCAQSKQSAAGAAPVPDQSPWPRGGAPSSPPLPWACCTPVQPGHAAGFGPPPGGIW